MEGISLQQATSYKFPNRTTGLSRYTRAAYILVNRYDEALSIGVIRHRLARVAPRGCFLALQLSRPGKVCLRCQPHLYAARRVIERALPQMPRLPHANRHRQTLSRAAWYLRLYVMAGSPDLAYE